MFRSWQRNMIVPDSNLLVYAYNDGAPQHNDARQWWEELISGNEVIGLPWVVTTGFVRLMTNFHLRAVTHNTRRRGGSRKGLVSIL